MLHIPPNLSISPPYLEEASRIKSRIKWIRDTPTLSSKYRGGSWAEPEPGLDVIFSQPSRTRARPVLGASLFL